MGVGLPGIQALLRVHKAGVTGGRGLTYCAHHQPQDKNNVTCRESLCNPSLGIQVMTEGYLEERLEDIPRSCLAYSSFSLARERAGLRWRHAKVVFLHTSPEFHHATLRNAAWERASLAGGALGMAGTKPKASQWSRNLLRSNSRMGYLRTDPRHAATRTGSERACGRG